MQSAPSSQYELDPATAWRGSHCKCEGWGGFEKVFPGKTLYSLKELLLRSLLRILEELGKEPAIMHPPSTESTKTNYGCSLLKETPFLFPSFLFNLNSDKSQAATWEWVGRDPEKQRWTISSFSLLVFHPEETTKYWRGENFILEGQTSFILHWGWTF